MEFFTVGLLYKYDDVYIPEEFPENVQLIIFVVSGMEEEPQPVYIPPPPSSPQLPEKVQLVIVGLDEKLHMPEPIPT